MPLQVYSAQDFVNPTAPQSSMYVIAYSPSGNPQVIPMSYFETAGGDAEFNDVQVNDDLNVDGSTTLQDTETTTLVSTGITATSLTTDVAAANVSISGNTIQAGGTDANVDVNITAKGTGVVYINEDWGVNQSGALVPAADNTYDIGNGLVNPRDVNVSRAVNTPVVTLTKVDGLIAANAVTADGGAGVLTSPALVNAAGTAYQVTFTNSNITATSNVTLQIRSYSGVITADGYPAIYKQTPGAGSIVFDIYNIAPVAALNGTVTIDYMVT